MAVCWQKVAKRGKLTAFNSNRIFNPEAQDATAAGGRYRFRFRAGLRRTFPNASAVQVICFAIDRGRCCSEPAPDMESKGFHARHHAGQGGRRNAPAEVGTRDRFPFMKKPSEGRLFVIFSVDSIAL